MQKVILGSCVVVACMSNGLFVRGFVENASGQPEKSANDSQHKSQQEPVFAESLPTPKQINNDIFNAARKGDDKRIAQLIRNGVDVNQADENGATPLHFAVGNDLSKTKAVSVLLKAGANINARNKVGATPLLSALYSYNGDEYARFLIEQGADVNIASDYKQTALGKVAGWRNSDIFILLLEKGADPNALDLFGYSPFMRIVRDGWKIEFIRLCLEKGANVHLVNIEGKSALMMAQEELAKEKNETAKKRLLEIIDELKNAGAIYSFYSSDSIKPKE